MKQAAVDEGRKRVLLIGACILAARKLAQYDDRHAQVPATITAVQDAIHWAERIMYAIDKRWPPKTEGSQ
jgi:hypothetical protein